MYNILQLNNKELNELQDIAAEMGIKGSKSLERQDLIYRILDEQAIAGAQKKVASEEAKGDRRQRTRVNKKEVANKVYSADKDKAEKINDTPKIVATPITEEKMTWMNGFPAYSVWWLLIHYDWYMGVGDLAYLQEHYGIQVDEKNYYVFYEVFGSNMMPDITVLEREA